MGVVKWNLCRFTAWVSGSIAIFLEANPEMKRDGSQGGVSAISNLKMIMSQNSEMKNDQDDHDDHYGYGLLRIDLLINETQNSSSNSSLLGPGFYELEDIQGKYAQEVQATRRMMASVPPDNSTKETE